MQAVESVWQERLCLRYLFQYLKHSIGGKRFSDNEEVKASVNSWLSDQAADLFEEGFQNLVLSRSVIRHRPTSPIRLVFNYHDHDSNNFKGHMFFPVVLSGKLGLSDNMSTGYM
ncbi:hypothetical protein TNCV_1494481 [Trichonephila clavipes]|nr:hypothetical protein TNCV_1494481 [Trichonephila clavipes]